MEIALNFQVTFSSIVILKVLILTIREHEHTLTCFNLFLHCLIVSIAKVLCSLTCAYLATLRVLQMILLP